MAKILDSLKISQALEEEIKTKLKGLPKLCLGSVVIGDNYSAGVYQSSQRKVALRLGVEYRPIKLAGDVSFDKFKIEIGKLNKDKSVTGIILNKPFPLRWKDSEVFSLLDERKDVEGMHPVNLGKLFIGDTLGASDLLCISPTVLSVIALLGETKVNLTAKKVTIVGFSSLIGKPLALFLGSEFATVSITHIETYKAGDLPAYLEGADIVISAVGKPDLIKGDWIKKGAIVIDVGTGQKNGKLCGDVEFNVAKGKASYITPVPAGTGKLTTMFLYNNLILTAKMAGL
ncbi:MAG: bifunctional 5,10-methylenetetrahydrofolate dehydrogenase/5,10-methenyltetrahydrofolate cyclohydrolase [Candidatus Omnitrophota bacterium]|nr:MAG: bifunctional 5,10-methylenetetrahydrofolate dehydrogenase/5,10-methenyltetrahydrofolate cyclohydrolase [Candidatus Omnitrophota bacterium]